MTFDEAVLDHPAMVADRDQHRLLWSLATAGAQVRRAVETAADFGVSRLQGGVPPRALLVAGDDATPGGCVLAVSLAAARAPALSWRRVGLPGWAGAADALLIGSVDGRDPRLAELAAAAVARGVQTAVVAPAGSPVAAAAAGRAPVHELPRNLPARAARWSVLAPMLQALDCLTLHPIPVSTLTELADALDAEAERCRPGSDAFTNPAKALAVELGHDSAVIAGAGLLAGVAAQTVAESLQYLAGASAVSVQLPDGVGRAGALLSGDGEPAGAGEHDLFRDPVEDGPLPVRARLLVIGDDGAPDDLLLGERSAAQLQLGELAARRAAAALHRLAGGLGLRSSSVQVPNGTPLARFAAATAFGDFTAAYLALGRGLDPGARGPAELER